MNWLVNNLDWLFSGVGLKIADFVAKRILKINSLENETNKETHIDLNTDQQLSFKCNTNIPEHNNDSPVITENPIEDLISKFYYIYEQHGVTRTQMPSFIDKKFNITFSDIANDNGIISKLNEELLQWTSSKFGINRGWFDAQADDILVDRMYNNINCYKNIWEFINIFIEQINEFGIYEYKNRINVYFLKTFCEFLGDETIGFKNNDADVIVIIAINIGKTSTSTINKYILITQNLIWNYWKSRQFIKKMIRVVCSLGISMHGYDITTEEFNEISSCKIVPMRILKKKGYTNTWHPDDYNGSPNHRINELEHEPDEDWQESLNDLDNSIIKIIHEKREF